MATPLPWTPPHGWWDDYPADKEETTVETKTICCCDGDYDYGRGSYVATHSQICPEHDMCSDCCEAKATEIVEGNKVCADCAKDYETLKGRWAKVSGGWVLEVENGPDHFCDPNGWRILAFVTPNVRRTGWIYEIGSGLQIGVGLACRRGTYQLLEDAMATVEKATAGVVTIVANEEEEGK